MGITYIELFFYCSIMLSLQTRIEIVQLYYINGQSRIQAMRKFNSAHGFKNDQFTLSAITKLVTKFETTGSVLDQAKCGRPSVSDEKWRQSMLPTRLVKPHLQQDVILPTKSHW